jgi:RNA recognition motif-containing protein
MRLYVSNLPSDVTDSELKTIFEPFGVVTGAAAWGISTQHNRVGLVVMAVKPQGAEIAAGALDRTLLRGVEMRVNVITPWEI